MSSGLCDLFEDKRKFCVFETRGYGFGSEINNLLYFLYYCKNNNVKFCFLNSNISSNSRRRRTSLRWEYYFPYMEKHINSCSELTTAFDFRSARNSRDVVKIGLNFFFTSVHKFSAIFKNAAPAHPIFLTESRVHDSRQNDLPVWAVWACKRPLWAGSPPSLESLFRIIQYPASENIEPDPKP